MRHLITVVGSQEMLRQGAPVLQLRDGESMRNITWYACSKQDEPDNLLDDARSFVLRLLRAPLLAYRFYLLVYNTKLWSGRRPLILGSFAVFAAAFTGYYLAATSLAFIVIHVWSLQHARKSFQLQCSCLDQVRKSKQGPKE